MENNIPWNIILKSFQKEASDQELATLKDWLESDNTNQKILTEIFNVYKVGSITPEHFTPDKQKAWEKINNRITSPGYQLRNFISKFRYAAASAILVLLSLAIIWQYYSGPAQDKQQYTEIIAPMGQKTMVILPDSSFVWLNSGSSLKYNGIFNKKDREVILRGEAFFDVKKDNQKHFRVKTGILFVEVYGTEFNIKNYEEDISQEITVSEGRVGLSDISGELRQLTSGQQAILDKNSGKIYYQKVNPSVVSSWKNNELEFDNTPITEVVKYLERWYGVNISIGSDMAGKHNYTFKIKTESLTEMLEKIKIMTPITYEIDGKDVKIKYIN